MASSQRAGEVAGLRAEKQGGGGWKANAVQWGGSRVPRIPQTVGCGEGGKGRPEFMPVAAVHPPSPTPRSYLAELSRSAIPPNHHREYRHETEPTHTHTHIYIHARSFPFGPCNFLLSSRYNFFLFLPPIFRSLCEKILQHFRLRKIHEILILIFWKRNITNGKRKKIKDARKSDGERKEGRIVSTFEKRRIECYIAGVINKISFYPRENFA